jgi:hypothetical protein
MGLLRADAKAPCALNIRHAHWPSVTPGAHTELSLAASAQLGALGMLAQHFRDEPRLIQPSFRALTDPSFNERDRQDALSLIDKAKNKPNSDLYALSLLKAYNQVIDITTDSPAILWARNDTA